MTEWTEIGNDKGVGKKEIQVMELQNTPSHRRDLCHMTIVVRALLNWLVDSSLWYNSSRSITLVSKNAG